MPLFNLHGGYTHSSSSGESNDGAGISNLVGLHFTMTGAAHTTSETGLLAGEFQRFGLMPCEGRCVCVQPGVLGVSPAVERRRSHNSPELPLQEMLPHWQ